MTATTTRHPLATPTDAQLVRFAIAAGVTVGLAYPQYLGVRRTPA